MKSKKAKRKLTEFQKKEIYKFLNGFRNEDDPEPQEVIVKRFGGNEEEYLLTMAKYHSMAWIF